jgi:tetratricopeptide (TPR) repeat protein
MQYRNTIKTIPQIAGELGVAYILEGGVQRYQDQVRISAQLIDANSDHNIWSENYDRDFTNIFDIQSEVAENIANTLKATIDPEVKERLVSKPTENMEAYNLVLEAKFLIDMFDQNDFPKARKMLEKAIELDPEFAEAYTWMALYWIGQSGFAGGPIASKKAFKEALPYLEKSLELDDKDPYTHKIAGTAYLNFQWDFEKAEREYEEARKLLPSAFMNPHYLLQSGKHQDALVMSNKNFKNDTINRFTWTTHGLSLFFNDQIEESVSFFKQALKKFPNDPMILSETGRFYVFVNEHQKSIEILESHLIKLDIKPPRDLAYLAIAYLKTNQPAKIQDILEELKQMNQESSSGSPAFYIALLYAQLGETDLAFEWLDKAYQEHEVEMVWLKVEPPFEPLRNDPRWQEMLDKVGFSD